MLTKKKVLIVDDDVSLSKILNLAFNLIGDIEVLNAYNGEEGIMKSISEKPDLIIMDYKMPGINGWEAAKRIKEDPITKNIPIIGYTAWAGKEDIQRGIKYGLNEIITKPIDVNIWEEKVKKYLYR